MTPERWEEVKALFAQALELPAAQRAAWIESRNSNTEVTLEVLRLLREHDSAGDDFLGPDTQGGIGLLDRAARLMAASASGLAATGALFSGRYEVVRELGSGGSGVVYLAQDRALHNRPVVLKFLFPGGEAQDRLSRRFRQEIEALARIRHPGVVGALDAGQADDGRFFLVMEYIEGTTLRAEMTAPMALPRVASRIREIAEALSAAHQAGVLHRDLKPENVMLQRTAGGSEAVKLIDFGIAKVQFSVPGERTHTVTFVGTIDYVAPEQLMGRASPETDVYALGLLTYEMLSGRRPFDPETPFALYELQKAGRIASLSRLRPEIPLAAERAILRALSFDPEKRQRSPVEFARELSAGLARKTLALRRFRWAAMVAVAAMLASGLIFERDAIFGPGQYERVVEFSGAREPVQNGYRAYHEISNRVELNLERTGYDALRLFSDTQGYYSHPLSKTQKAAALSKGWRLRWEGKAMDGWATVGLDLLPGRRFEMSACRSRGGPQIAFLTTHSGASIEGLTYEIPGAPENRHVFELTYDVASKTCSMAIDGVEKLRGYAGLTDYQEDRGLIWGTSIYKSEHGVAVFKSVRFEINP